ncbi:MAG: hypothetical protein HXY42_12760 [Chloroflexi bacterium]|nr:hypothetical protein [Chloroflexota bacterium]
MGIMDIGIVELFVLLFTTMLWLAVPLGILYLLYAIYKKISVIEEQLKRNEKR